MFCACCSGTLLAKNDSGVLYQVIFGIHQELWLYMMSQVSILYTIPSAQQPLQRMLTPLRCDDRQAVFSEHRSVD